MIIDCLEVYKEIKEKHQNSISLILDSYIPADGLYVIVNPDGGTDEVVVKMDKKNRKVDRNNRHYTTICKYDYYSRYLNSNKAVDTKKIIQSNNYLSFFIKKESLINGKLTEERIDEYFDILADPYRKYTKTKAKARQIYSNVEEELGPPDRETLERNRAWIKEHIFQFECEGKEYLKIFFRAEAELFEKEGKRYFIPNLYNNNEYNIEIGGRIYGLPDNNLNMNAKKPFLEHKDRKITMPYMLQQDEALLQKEFFDLLMNFCMEGKYNIFIDTSDEPAIYARTNGMFPDPGFSGVFLRIQKGKTEAEIHSQDVIAAYEETMKPFQMEDVLKNGRLTDEKHGGEYRVYTAKTDFHELLSEVFFNKMLSNNYFTKPEDISSLIKDGYLKTSLLQAREKIFGWLYKGDGNGVWEVLDLVSMRLICGSIELGYLKKAVRQFNLRASLRTYLKGEDYMGDTRKAIHDGLFNKINESETGVIETDKEYYYAIGQLVQYFLSKSKVSKKTYALANPFLNAKNEKTIKEKLQQFFVKYNYEIEWKGRRFKNLYAMVNAYESEGKVLKDDIIAGLLSNCMIYEKKEEVK